MKQFYIKNDQSGDHYAVGSNSINKTVLLQVQENGVQARIPLQLDQALHLMEMLAKQISNISPEAK